MAARIDEVIETRVNDQLVFEEILIGGEPPPLRLEQARVPIDDVRLDTGNPRLRYQQLMFPEKSLSDLLFEENDTRLLKEDILRNGLIDPPYLRRDPDGKFTVIEGNRRTAVMQKLHADHPTDDRFASMYARILPGDTPVDRQALLMAQFHIAGKLKWNAHEKAGHIYTMWKKLQVPMDQLKATLHMGEPAIRATVAAYEMLTERYATIDNGKYKDKADGKWSYFAELYKTKDLRVRVAGDKNGLPADPYFADRFCRWVGETRIPQAVDVRKLPMILKDSRALAQFEGNVDGAFERALEIAQSDPAEKSKFFKALRDLHKAGLAANMFDIQMAASDDKAKKALSDAKKILEGISRQASIA